MTKQLYDFQNQEFDNVGVGAEGTNTEPDVSYGPVRSLDPATSDYISESNIPNLRLQDQNEASKYDVGASVSEDLNAYRAEQQNEATKALLSIVGGAVSGLGTALEDIGYMTNIIGGIERVFMGAAPEASKNPISGIGQWVKDWATDNVKVYEEELDPDAGIWESFARWESVRGILDSGVGYGLAGLFAGGVVTKVASFLNKSRRMMQVGDVVHKTLRLQPQTMAAALATNYGEGTVMSLQVQDEMMAEFQPLIDSGVMTKEDALVQVTKAANRFQRSNLLFLTTDYLGFNRLFFNFKSRSPSIGRFLFRATVESAPREYVEEVGQQMAQDNAMYLGYRNAEKNLGLYGDIEKKVARTTLGDVDSIDRDQANEIIRINNGLSTPKSVYLKQFNTYYNTKEGEKALERIKKQTSDEGEILKLADEQFLKVMQERGPMSNFDADIITRLGESFMSVNTQVQGIMGAISGPGQQIITSSRRIRSQVDAAIIEEATKEKARARAKAYVENRMSSLNRIESLVDDMINSELAEVEEDAGSGRAMAEIIPDSQPEKVDENISEVNDKAETAVSEEKQNQDGVKSNWATNLLMKNAWSTIMLNSIATRTHAQLDRLLEAKEVTGTDEEKERATALRLEFKNVRKAFRKNRMFYNQVELGFMEITLNSWKSAKESAKSDKSISDAGRDMIDEHIADLTSELSRRKSFKFQGEILTVLRSKWKKEAKEKEANKANTAKAALELANREDDFGVWNGVLKFFGLKRGINRTNKPTESKKSKIEIDPKIDKDNDELIKGMSDSVQTSYAEVVGEINNKLTQATNRLKGTKEIGGDTAKLEKEIDTLNQRKQALTNVLQRATRNKVDIKDLKVDVETEVQDLIKRGSKSYTPKFNEEKGEFVTKNFKLKKGKNYDKFADKHETKTLEQVATDEELRKGIPVTAKFTDATGAELSENGNIVLTTIGNVDQYIVTLDNGMQEVIIKDGDNFSVEGAPYQKNGKTVVLNTSNDDVIAGSVGFKGEFRVSDDVNTKEYVQLSLYGTEELDSLSDELYNALRADVENETPGDSFYDNVDERDKTPLQEGLTKFQDTKTITDEYAETLVRVEKYLELSDDHQAVYDKLNRTSAALESIIISEFKNNKKGNYPSKIYIDFLEKNKKHLVLLNSIYNSHNTKLGIPLTKKLDRFIFEQDNPDAETRTVERGRRLTEILNRKLARSVNNTTALNAVSELLEILRELHPIKNLTDFVRALDSDIGTYLQFHKDNKSSRKDARVIASDKFLSLKEATLNLGLKNVDNLTRYEDALSNEEGSFEGKQYSEAEVLKNTEGIVKNFNEKQEKLEEEKRSDSFFETTKKLVLDAFNKLAYLSQNFLRKFNIDSKTGIMNMSIEDLDEAVMWSKAISPTFGEGDIIVLSEDKEYAGDINFDGNKIPYKEFIDKYKDSETVDVSEYAPIKIETEDGELLGYLHTVDFMDFYKIRGDIAENKKNVTKIRKHIVDKGTIKTEVISKGAGVFIVLNEAQTTSEVVGDDVNVFIGGLGGKLLRGKDTANTVVLDDTELLLGNPYMELRVGKKKEDLVYLPLRNQRLNEQHIRTIREAIRIYTQGDTKAPLNKRIIALKQKGVSSLTTENGIRSFLKKYLYFGKYNSKAAFGKESMRKAANKRIASFAILKGDILFGGSKPLTLFKEMDMSEFDKIMDIFENQMVPSLNVRMNVDKLLLDDKKFSALELVDDKGTIKETNEKNGAIQSYNSFTKNNTKSIIAGIKHKNKDGKTEWAYTLQNTIYFDYGFIKKLKTFDEKLEDIKNNKDNFEGITIDGRVVDLDSGEEYVAYRNKETGKTYQRVSDFIAEEGQEFPTAKRKDETFKEFDKRLIKEGLSRNERFAARLVASSQIIGNKIDTIVRDFFDGTLKDNKHYEISSDENFEEFVKSLHELKKYFNSKGEVVLANDILVYNDRLGVAGTVDLLTYDGDGVFRVYDMKSLRGDNFVSGKFGAKYESTSVFEITDKTKPDGSPVYKIVKGKKQSSKKVKHQKQVSTYSIALSETHEVEVAEGFIIPIETDYKESQTNVSRLDLLPLIKLPVLLNSEEINPTVDDKTKKKKSDDKETARGKNRDDNANAESTKKQQAKNTINKLNKGGRGDLMNKLRRTESEITEEQAEKRKKDCKGKGKNK